MKNFKEYLDEDVQTPDREAEVDAELKKLGKWKGPPRSRYNQPLRMKVRRKLQKMKNLQKKEKQSKKTYGKGGKIESK